MAEEWISASEFAAVTGTSRQAAHKALRRALSGRLWNSNLLVARRAAAPLGGGRSGVRYEVALSSLSEELQRRFRGEVGHDVQRPDAPIGCGYQPAPDQGEEQYRRWRVIEDALNHPARSAERKGEVLRAAAKWGESVRTIYRWIANLEKSGGDVNALGRKRPADAGQRRVGVSRKFDAAFARAGLDAALLPELAGKVDQLIRAAWASPVQRAGWQQVRREVVTAFQRHLRERGLSVPIAERDISQRRIGTDAHYRIVDIRAHDRKRYDDMKPRIRRNNAAFLPMEQVIMDVKPTDNWVIRPHGTRAKPRMIAFQCAGTQRVFRHFVLCPAGEGVRQEHVAEAFLGMVMHPEWGMPQQLYRDNGTEFYIMDMVRSALALINAPGARTIINAKPYSGASKPIESKFAHFDRFVFSQMGGYTGGKIGQAKTQNVGQLTKPYAGSFDDFVREANERIEEVEHRELQSGPMKGYSPMSKFAERIAEGWRPVMIDPLALDAAFCKHDSRTVRQHAVSIGGSLYRHPDLPNGREVGIALPWRRGAAPLINIPELGWAALEPDMLYLPGDIAGAVQSGRMQQRNDCATRELKRSAGVIDLHANRRDRVTALPTRAAPAPLIDLAMSDEAQQFAGARIAAAERQSEQLSEFEQATRRRKLLTAALERKYADRG